MMQRISKIGKVKWCDNSKSIMMQRISDMIWKVLIMLRIPNIIWKVQLYQMPCEKYNVV